MAKQAESGALNAQQERFCREYIIDLNGTKAAIRAGYEEKSAAAQASRLLTNAKIHAFVEELAAARSKRLEVAGDDVLRELIRIGYSDIRALYNENGTVKHPTEWPEELARAISSIEVEETFERKGKDLVWTGYTKKVRFWQKGHALELLGKHKALFTDKVEHSGKVTLEQLVAQSRQPDSDKEK